MSEPVAILVAVAVGVSPLAIALAVAWAMNRPVPVPPWPERPVTVSYRCPCGAYTTATTAAAYPPSSLPCSHCSQGTAKRVDQAD